MFQINFSKAYDRVENFYMWEIMEQVGFSTEFIKLVQGLVLPGTAKVHFNGLFTPRFPLQRGVRQGCPLAPLLYSLSTQPLMILFQEKLKAGTITGIHIGEGKQLLHQLFADDTGVFIDATEESFEAMMDCLHAYERISGQKLNLEKSTLVQLDQGPRPLWLSHVGSNIAEDRDQLVYLGCPFGRQMTPEQELMYILSKMRTRLRHWTNRFLSITSKLVLVKHVLKAMPTFFLMLLDLSQEGFRKLEAVCRTFLWGHNVNLNPKVPLVAWSKICQAKED
jgi:hypothetical protein